MKQTLDNLIVNALKYCKQGTIKLELTKKGSMASFRNNRSRHWYTKKLLKEGASNKLIAKVTGMKESEIKALQK